MKAKHIFYTAALFGLIGIGIAEAQNISDSRLTKNQIVLGGKKVRVYDSSNAKYVEISHNGTNAVIDASSGSVSVPDGIVGAITGNADTATSLAVNPSDCSSGQFATTIAANGNLTCSNLTTNAAISTTVANAAGASATAISDTATLGIMDGSDTYNGVNVSLTNANHTGASNAVNGINVGSITADPDATETAIKIGNGWDLGIDAGNNQIKTTGGLDLSGSNINGANNILANGSITSAATTNIGWSITTAANQACNTTCTFACVFGWDTSAGESAVACADATADKCLCAGAN